MGKEKLILSQDKDKFYLSVLNEIVIGKINSNCDDLDDNAIISVKYLNFFKNIDIAYTSNKNNIGQKQDYGSIYLIYTDLSKFIIPKGMFELSKDVFDKLRKVLKNYDNIFEIEFREFYTDDNDNFENYKVNIDYEIIKLENPVKNKNCLFRLKDNNIPTLWIEQSKDLIKYRKNLNSKYGNISDGKINLITSDGCIPKNIDFIINEEYAKRLDELFKSWNNGNIKSKKSELIEFLFKEYGSHVTSCKDNYFINLDNKITVSVDVEKLEIMEFKTIYYNINMSSYNKLVTCINNIQKEINKLKE